MRLWLWLVPLTLLWPGLHLAVFLVRFARLPPGGATDALVFLPMGLLSGILLIVLWNRAATRAQRLGTGLGYVLASPIAFVGSLVSGLLLPPLLGTLLYGVLPLAGGMLIGYALPRNRPEGSYRVGEHRGMAAGKALRLRTLGWLWIVYSIGLGLVALGAYAFFSSRGAGQNGDQFLLLALTQLPGLAGGIAALRQRGWSVYVLTFTAILNLIAFPIGTLLALYTLWLMVTRQLK